MAGDRRDPQQGGGPRYTLGAMFRSWGQDSKNMFAFGSKFREWGHDLRSMFSR